MTSDYSKKADHPLCKLYVIRGLPTTGKTELARKLAPSANFSMEDYYVGKKIFTYSTSYKDQATDYCLQMCTDAMTDEIPVIAVHGVFSNTGTVRPFIKAANRHNYQVSIIECQTQQTTRNSPPRRVLSKIRKKWEQIVM
jgi:hypothetical protein